MVKIREKQTEQLEKAASKGLKLGGWKKMTLSSKIAAVVLVLVALTAILAPLLAPYSPVEIFTARQAPGNGFIFGTDDKGRDILSRMLYGGRYSLIIGFGATAMALVCGSVVGALAAVSRKAVSETIMRILDIIMSIPGIALAAVFVSILGNSVPSIIFAIGFMYTPQIARIVRANIVSEYGEDYVRAVIVSGAKAPWILIKHVLRNCIAPIMVFTVTLVADAIIFEASLTFIGAGIQEPTATWGNILADARGGVLGDTLASVLDWSGANVWREFYVNDFGNQIEKFAKSIEARYFQLIKGEDAVEFPEDGYHGDDIKELAQAFYAEHGESYLDKTEAERHADMARFGLDRNIPKMKSDLERYGIKFDEWFFESSLHESGFVADTAKKLTDLGWTYEKDGALWVKTAEIMRDQYRKQGKKDEDIDKLGLKDDVLRRANGFYTYLAGDIAYHRNKFEVRGFDKVINIWGADHHGHVARLKGAIDALGLDGTNRLDIVLMQLVKLVRDGEVVRMSKRTGKTISLSDLLDEIPVDACRYFFNAKPDTQMDFDLGLAVREDSENPVYYIQYAYARICSLLKTMADEGRSVPAADKADLSLLSGEQERALIKELANFSEEIRMAARDYDPSYINRYLMRLAAAFHKFYNACRIKGEDEAVIDARLKLASATRQVLANGLKVIGCSAPEKM